MITTSGFLTAQECTQFVFSLYSAGRCYRLPRSPAGSRGTYTFKERGGEEKETIGENREREGKGR